MQTVKLGKTGLAVTQVGFGGIPIISVPPEQAVAIVRHSFDLGVRFFDTANMYTTSEEKIGTALKAVRQQVVLATKTTDRTAAGAAEHIALSLKQLQTDWIDLYQLHNVSNPETLDQVLGPDGAYAAAEKARQAGKIRHIGLSSHNIEIAIAAVKTGLFETIQFPFNFIEDEPLKELFPLARQKAMGIIAMKPLGGGLLGKARLCFGFLQQHPHVVPIPGIRIKTEVDEIAALYHRPEPLAAADRKAMQKIRSDLGDKFCHRCEYCMPCEQGVAISNVLMFPAAAKRLAPNVVRSWLKGAIQSVDNCIACQECEAKCPYALPIPELLKAYRLRYDEFVANTS